MIIHDHFDGSSHCVECGGLCQLSEDERNVSALVRFVFEEMAATGQGRSMMVWFALNKLGVDTSHFLRRARETHRRSLSTTSR